MLISNLVIYLYISIFHLALHFHARKFRHFEKFTSSLLFMRTSKTAGGQFQMKSFFFSRLHCHYVVEPCSHSPGSLYGWSCNQVFSAATPRTSSLSDWTRARGCPLSLSSDLPPLNSCKLLVPEPGPAGFRHLRPRLGRLSANWVRSLTAFRGADHRYPSLTIPGLSSPDIKGKSTTKLHKQMITHQPNLLDMTHVVMNKKTLTFAL